MAERNDADVAAEPRGLGIRCVPAVVIDGKLAKRRAGDGPEEGALKVAGVGTPI